MHKNGVPKSQDEAAPPALDVQDTAETQRVIKGLEKDLSEATAYLIELSSPPPTKEERRRMIKHYTEVFYLAEQNPDSARALFLAYQTAYQIFFLLDHGVTQYVYARVGRKINKPYARKLNDFTMRYGLQVVELGKCTDRVIEAAEKRAAVLAEKKDAEKSTTVADKNPTMS